MTAGTPLRFLIVGLFCALTHNAIMIVADRFGMHYTLASVLSYGVVVILGFWLHVQVTFQQSATLAAFGRYALGMAANYPLTLALLFLLCDLVGWRMAIAAPTATVLLVAWNFAASRWAIVRAPEADDPRPLRRPS